MKKLKALWDLFRLDHGLMLIIAVFIGSVIAYEGLPTDWFKLMLAFLTALFLEMSTFALNDYFDYRIDKMNNRLDRPLVRGDIKPRTALMLSAIFFPTGLIASFFVNMTCFIIALITGLFAIAYDIKLKKIKLVGNYYIAYTMAIPFLFGGVVFSRDIQEIIWVLASIAFLSGVGREIMKDVMDMSGDKLDKVRSLPMYVGKNISYLISGLFFLSAVMISIIPFIINLNPSYHFNYIYLGLVSTPDALFIWITVSIIFKEEPNVKLFRKMSLLALIFGLIAFLGGALL